MACKQFREARDAARRYRDLGLSPLPSRMTGGRKRPALPSYSQYRTEPLPESYFDDWGTTNIQLMTGVQAYGPLKIIVVDCDGPEAGEAFRGMPACHDTELPTWRARTGGGGEHFYLTLPPGVTSCPSGLIWDGKARHKEVRILGDGQLAVAPPSRHVVSLGRYEWLGPITPATLARPMPAPDWLLDLPRLAPPKPAVTPPARYAPRKAPRMPRERFPDRDVVQDAVADKIAVAATWGLRVAGPTNPSGWASCYAAGREEDHPSASIHAETGVYMDLGRDGKAISFFDLGVRLGQFRDWQQCLNWVAANFGCPGGAAKKFRR